MQGESKDIEVEMNQRDEDQKSAVAAPGGS